MTSNILLAVVRWAAVLLLAGWYSIGRCSPPHGEDWDSGQRDHHHRERQYWRNITIITLIAAVGASLSAAFAWRAVQASRDQIAVARDSEMRQLRAYVAMTGISLAADVSGQGKLYWFIRPIWRNSGQTPTFHLSITSYTFATYKGGGPSVGSFETDAFSLGPGDRSETVFNALSQMAEPNRQSSVEARGVAVYEDVVGHWRITVSCRRTVRLDSEPILTSATAPTKINPETVPCGEWNCFDEECASYRMAIENIPSPLLPALGGGGFMAPKVPASAYGQ